MNEDEFAEFRIEVDPQGTVQIICSACGEQVCRVTSGHKFSDGDVMSSHQCPRCTWTISLGDRTFTCELVKGHGAAAHTCYVSPMFPQYGGSHPSSFLQLHWGRGPSPDEPQARS